MDKVRVDLFTFKGRTYLLVVNYFSRYVEIAYICPTRGTDVIVHLKSTFVQHGIPETLTIENRPQFSGHEMKEFADSIPCNQQSKISLE